MSVNNVFEVDPFLQTRFDVIQGFKMFEALDVHDRESILKCLNEITLSLSEECGMP